MKKFIIKNHRILFYITWFLIGIVQAYTTELMDDEAYYWLYSQYPDFGYFDHPPMIAFVIKAGYFFFHNELGVRFFIVVFNTATVYIIQQLLQRKNDFLFYAILGSMALAQVGGFIAVPDGPMLFFTALFFLVYRKFIQQPGLLYSVLLGVIGAALLYSKYHGVLICILVLVSNPKLLKSYHIWLAGLVALILFAPHLYWQYLNDFPSVQFHLNERIPPAYRINFTTDYVFGQVLLAGPIIGWLFIWSAFKYNTTSLTERALKFTLTGVYIFFLLSSFKYRVEANWTVPAYIALIILSHQYLDQHFALRKWVYRTLPFSLLFVLVIRVSSMSYNSVLQRLTKKEFHGNRSAAEQIMQKAGGLPVVFISSYQRPSKYWFYTHQISFSLNVVGYHRNSFNYWPVEDSLIGRQVYLISKRDSVLYAPLNLKYYPGTDTGVINNFFSFSKIRFTDVKIPLANESTLILNCLIKTPPGYLSFFKKDPFDTANIYMAFYDARGEVSSYVKSNFGVKQITDPVLRTSISWPLSLAAGKYRCRIVLSCCLPGLFTLNSNFFEVNVKK